MSRRVNELCERNILKYQTDVFAVDWNWTLCITYAFSSGCHVCYQRFTPVLLQYTSRNKNIFGIGRDACSLAPYSLSPVSAKSQKLLRSPRKATRKISRIPFKVL